MSNDALHIVVCKTCGEPPKAITSPLPCGHELSLLVKPNPNYKRKAAA